MTTAALEPRHADAAAGSLGPFAPLMDRVLVDARAHFDAADVRLVARRLEKRPFSWLLRVAVQRTGDASPMAHLFVKRSSVPATHTHESIRERVARDFETTSRVCAALAPWPDLGAVRPVACYPDELTMVTEEAAGDTLGAYLDARVRWFPGHERLAAAAAVLHTVGRWVRRFQGIDERQGVISLDEFHRYVDVRLQRLVSGSAGAFGEADRGEVLRHVDRLSRLVSPGDLRETLMHADLAPGNVIVAGTRVVVLDFAMAHRGSTWQDVSRLYVQLDLLGAKPQFRRSVLDVLRRALLRGFDPDLTSDRPLFRLFLLRHHVNHLGTVTSRPARFPVSVYDAHVGRLHRRWIRNEVRAAAASGGGR